MLYLTKLMNLRKFKISGICMLAISKRLSNRNVDFLSGEQLELKIPFFSGQHSLDVTNRICPGLKGKLVRIWPGPDFCFQKELLCFK